MAWKSSTHDILFLHKLLNGKGDFNELVHHIKPDLHLSDVLCFDESEWYRFHTFSMVRFIFVCRYLLCWLLIRRVRRDSNRIRGVGVGGRGSGRRTTHQTSVNATVLRYDASELATCVFIYVCLSTQFKVLEENLSIQTHAQILRTTINVTHQIPPDDLPSSLSYSSYINSRQQQLSTIGLNTL